MNACGLCWREFITFRKSSDPQPYPFFILWLPSKLKTKKSCSSTVWTLRRISINVVRLHPLSWQKKFNHTTWFFCEKFSIVGNQLVLSKFFIPTDINNFADTLRLLFLQKLSRLLELTSSCSTMIILPSKTFRLFLGDIRWDKYFYCRDALP